MTTDRYGKRKLEFWVDTDLASALDRWAEEIERPRAWLLRFIIQRALDDRKLVAVAEDIWTQGTVPLTTHAPDPEATWTDELRDERADEAFGTNNR